nr:transposase [Streptomyces cavernae]
MRDIRSHLAAICGVEVSTDLISTVTDAVVDELAAWQNRPLDVVWPKDHPKLVPALKAIYTAPTEQALDAFAASDLGKRYPAIVKTWQAAWSEFTPYLAFPAEIRKVVYSTNMVE